MGLHLRKRALAVSVVILLNLSGQAIAKDKEIVVVSWGGAYTDSQQKAKVWLNYVRRSKRTMSPGH